MFPYLKTIHHSSNLISASPIKLYEKGKELEAIVFAKTSSLEFYLQTQGTLVYSHTIEIYSGITVMLVIPTRHKWSDSILIADD